MNHLIYRDDRIVELHWQPLSFSTDDKWTMIATMEDGYKCRVADYGLATSKRLRWWAHRAFEIPNDSRRLGWPDDDD